jgi:hypothetical protein
MGADVDFEIPADLAAYLAELDEFIELQIRPLEQQDGNARFFDHRREDARTDWDRGGLPNREWEALLAEAVRRADAAGHYRYAFPAEYGGRGGTNLGMAVIREHLASNGLGLHCDLQNEHMIVGNNVGLLLMLHYGTPEQCREWTEVLAAGRTGFAFGITEPAHGSDATFMETTARREAGGWLINGEKTWNTGVHAASHDLIFARTSGRPGDGDGITAFLTPVSSPGFTVEEYLWTFNMPTAYRAAGGADITPDELRWWEIFGTLRWGVIGMEQAQAHLSGAHRSVELAAVGRRVCEQEWDLLLLLAPDDAARAAARRPRVTGAAQPAPAPHGRPTASELLEAVQEFLTGQVMPACTGQLAFHSRVAANVLGIVARELELGAIPPESMLADNVAARLAAANPRYFDPAPPP